MKLKNIRHAKKLSQRRLAIQSGVNFHSLQDYEQGHKRLLSANGETLLRLATTLGCSVEALLLPNQKGAPLHPKNRVPLSEILQQRFYCEKHETAGRWVSDGKTLSILFYYEGQQYLLPFSAYFDARNTSPLCDAAVLQMEEAIEDSLFERDGFESWRKDK